MLRQFLYQIKLNRDNGSDYFQLKHYFKWKNSLKEGASSVKDEQPWITYDAITFLDKHVNLNSSVFEYGGGGSTLFFTKRAREVVTAEHNKEWFELLEKMLSAKNITNWKGNYILPESGNLVSSPDPANPEHYSSADIPSKNFNYKNYASAIDVYTDEYFDFILVDGRSRPSCMQHAITKLKKGGYLLLDNSERKYYLQMMQKIIDSQFECVLGNSGASPYSNEFTQTTIWKKRTA